MAVTADLFSNPSVLFGLSSGLMLGFGAAAALLINKANSRTTRAEDKFHDIANVLSALDEGQQWLLFINNDGTVKSANLAFHAAIGTNADHLHDKKLIQLLEPLSRDNGTLVRLDAAVRARQPLRLQLNLQNPLTGDMHAWLLSGRTYDDASNDGYWILGVDITPEKAHENELRTLAYTDTLTNMPNRAALMQQLSDPNARANIRSIFHITFPRLSFLVNSLGREQAELFMINVAGRLRESLTPYQSAARIGQASFAIVEKRGAGGTAEESANELGRSLAKPFELIEHEVQLIPAIGVALADNNISAEEWLNNADLAARALHVRNKPEIGLYNADVRAKLARLRGLESDLRRAIYFAPEQLYPVYQPIYRLSDNKLIGFEMLARWQHPLHGNVPPLEFIPVAEESGLIAALWVQLFAQSCRQLRDWHNIDTDLFMSVNLSSRQFSLPGLIKTVDTLVEVTGVSPAAIKLEITETEMMDNPEAAMEQMLALKARGFRLSIDDFGTGFSSLSYLHKLPISDVKIDRSFVKSMHDNAANLEIVSMIARLGEKLGHTTTAEGIETASDLSVLRDLGCTLGQGYFFAKPLPAPDIFPLLKPHTSH